MKCWFSYQWIINSGKNWLPWLTKNNGWLINHWWLALFKTILRSNVWWRSVNHGWWWCVIGQETWSLLSRSIASPPCSCTSASRREKNPTKGLQAGNQFSTNWRCLAAAQSLYKLDNTMIGRKSATFSAFVGGNTATPLVRLLGHVPLDSMVWRSWVTQSSKSGDQKIATWSSVVVMWSIHECLELTQERVGVAISHAPPKNKFTRHCCQCPLNRNQPI